MLPSRFDVAASGGVGPCFGEPVPLPLPGGDDELFSPTGNGDLSPCCVVDGCSPTFEKSVTAQMEKTIEGTRFVAQHMRNKDKFESVSVNVKKKSIPFFSFLFHFCIYARHPQHSCWFPLALLFFVHSLCVFPSAISRKQLSSVFLAPVLTESRLRRDP